MSYTALRDGEARIPRFHLVKSWTHYFDPVERNLKQFDLRKNDRNYLEGDILVMREWDRIMSEYTNRWAARTVTYVMRSSPLGIDVPHKGLDVGYVILSLGPCNSAQTAVAEEEIRRAQAKASPKYEDQTAGPPSAA